MESLSSATSTCCSLERCCTLNDAPIALKLEQVIQQRDERGLRASAPKIRLKTKSVLGSANAADMGRFYTRGEAIATRWVWRGSEFLQFRLVGHAHANPSARINRKGPIRLLLGAGDAEERDET